MIPDQRQTTMPAAGDTIVAARPINAKPTYVYAIHVTCGGPCEPDSVGPVETIFTDDARALSEAKERSRAPKVLAAAVTRYALNELGNRRRVALFVDGARQQHPHVTDDHRYRDG